MRQPVGVDPFRWTEHIRAAVYVLRLVYIDASHSYSYVRSDTEAALSMLSHCGTIICDDYTHYAGIYANLNELSPQLEGGIVHLLGTRLAMFTNASTEGHHKATPTIWR